MAVIGSFSENVSLVISEVPIVVERLLTNLSSTLGKDGVQAVFTEILGIVNPPIAVKGELTVGITDILLNHVIRLKVVEQN